MSATGVNYRDLLPVPEKTNAVTDPDQHEQATAFEDGPTASHALASAATDVPEEEKGAAQEEHDGEVLDLGWNEEKQKIPQLVGGLDNEELWLLVRRFNKQMYHVKEVTTPVPGNLDLNIADEDEFSPDKLRSTLERLYMTVGLGLLSFGKHIVRIRSWRETRRTTMFCVIYFVAWALDFLVPTFSLMVIALIAFPPSRGFLFPPAPIALVGSDGAPKKPKAGVLGSHDSATGAPENFKGEAAEAEAQNFVNGIAHIALSSATGKHPMDDEQEEGAPSDSAPDPTAVAVSGANARVASSGKNPGADKTKARVPMETAMWNKMRPIMHSLQDIVDGWERFANALDPTPPFPQEPFRLRIATLVIPVFAISIFITSYMFMKGVTFGVGFGFFGDPLVWRGLDFLNRKVPNWQKMLELRNTLLKGVPTNAQLTVTLLRIGEANKAPLPPPPYYTDAPPNDVAHVSDEHLGAIGEDAPLGATDEELRAAMEHDGGAVAHHIDDDAAAAKDTKHGKKGSKILGFLKGGVKASVETAIGADRLKANVGNTKAKNRLGVVPRPRPELFISGPIEFNARFHGRKGHVYIVNKATIPCVAFTTDSTVEKIGTQDREDLHPAWSVAVADIKELKKVGGFGWKARLVVGWALDRQVADGLEIIDKRGNTWKVTAMPLRDELFNRLIAMGGQKWESW
ncbi:hypothetical protein FH972_021716 [Carpinus fangiana]|uniref:Uncharacterized protein n=1 Tax=Carpinus fangiana TaxID=176857 RepID=A0A5N6KS83_9ROSI|nr:hypothetical protein FH972_021716 [Carpinus fangiana]